MLLDSLLNICDPQAITSTAISEHVIDLGPLTGGDPVSTIRDIGAGEELHLTVGVRTLFESGGSTTLTVSLESSAAAGLTSATVHWTTGAIAKADLVAGYRIANGIILPPGNYLRYLGLRFTVASGPFTAGDVVAWLHKGRVDSRTYPGASRSGVNSVAVLS